MDLRNFVDGYLYPFLFDLVHVVGGDDGNVLDVYYDVKGWEGLNVFGVDLSGLVYDLLFFPISLWFLFKYARSWTITLLNNLAEVVRTWIAEAVDWVRRLVQGIYDWVTSQLWAIINWVTQFLGNIWRQLQAAIQSVISWVSGLVAGVISFIQAQIANLVAWVGAQVRSVLEWVTQNVVGPFLRLFDVFQPILGGVRQLADIIALWTQGLREIAVGLVSNPAGLIFALIEDKFIPWALGLIARNW